MSIKHRPSSRNFPQKCPTDGTKNAAIEQRLADAHITPVWYPEGEHGYVAQILTLLVD